MSWSIVPFVRVVVGPSCWPIAVALTASVGAITAPRISAAGTERPGTSQPATSEAAAEGTIFYDGEPLLAMVVRDEFDAALLKRAEENGAWSKRARLAGASLRSMVPSSTKRSSPQITSTLDQSSSDFVLATAFYRPGLNIKR